MTLFNKDIWIKDAIARNYLIVERDGAINRCARASADGKLLSDKWLPVRVQIHKATGRVYFNMQWRGITKSVLVNRVVALCFLPNPHNLPQVNHIDGNIENNHVDNLEWVSSGDNERHAYRTGLKTGHGSANANAKLKVQDILAIRASDEPAAKLAIKYSVSYSTITGILKRKTWAHI